MSKVNTTKNIEEKIEENVDQVVNTTENIEEKIDSKVEKRLTKDALKIGKLFAKEEKIATKIPIDPQNPKDLMVVVKVNGYAYNIKRGETVKLPTSIVKILENAKYI